MGIQVEAAATTMATMLLEMVRKLLFAASPLTACSVMLGWKQGSERPKQSALQWKGLLLYVFIIIMLVETFLGLTAMVMQAMVMETEITML